VGHELTHGVTQDESNLFYYYQSGAINESFSDFWGELYDQQNGSADDGAANRWELGEGSTAGVLRSMSNPPDHGHPDRITSPDYYEGVVDGGGVHTNSGVNNKAAYLLVDGGSFNGKTVSALGANKTLAVYYEVQTNLLTSGADYLDLYNALYQGCLNLAGGTAGITAGDCQEVRDATDAVEMNLQPATGFNTDAPLCEAGYGADTILFDGWAGTGNWTLPTHLRALAWDQPDYGWGDRFAHSGQHHLFANDYPAAVADATARLIQVSVPANAYLHFAHAYDFEQWTEFGTDTDWYDGGVLEYSTNGGGSWIDAGSLITHNGYDGVIYAGYAGHPEWDNPLKGRSAFVGTSHGYIDTRLDLSSLAGRNVRFRWRMGLDAGYYSWGWWLDDVRVYQCEAVPTSIARHLDDRHPGWSLTGAWPRYALGTAYSGTIRFTGTPGNAASFDFNGNRFTLSYISHPTYGTIGVYLDGSGTPLATLDATLPYARRSYTSPALTPGPHTVSIKHNGPASTYIVIDALLVSSDAPRGFGTHDDEHPGWTYTGSWLPYTIPGMYNNTMHFTTTPGDAAAFYLDGNGFTLHYRSAPGYGSIGVYLDGSGTPLTTLDANQATARRSYTSPALTAGPHVITFKHDGAAGTAIVIDDIQVTSATLPGAGMYDDRQPEWSFGIGWAPYSLDGPQDNTIHYTATPATSAAFSFNGAGFKLHYLTNPAYSTLGVYLDGSGTPLVTINTAVAASLATYTSPALTPGPHTVVFKHNGSPGTYIVVDAIEVN
jgi:hemin uptake protein HemP